MGMREIIDIMWLMFNYCLKCWVLANVSCMKCALDWWIILVEIAVMQTITVKMESVKAISHLMSQHLEQSTTPTVLVKTNASNENDGITRTLSDSVCNCLLAISAWIMFCLTECSNIQMSNAHWNFFWF